MFQADGLRDEADLRGDLDLLGLRLGLRDEERREIDFLE